MSKKKKKIVWQQLVGNAFMMLVGVFCGVFMVLYVDSPEFDSPIHVKLFALAGLLLLMYVSLFLQTVIHEAGHLVFGLLSGYKFSSFRIFSFMWLKEKGKIRLKKLTIAGTAGQCLMAPPNVTDGKAPTVLYNLGGSIMNVIASTVVLPFYLIFREIPYVSAALFLFILLGYALALMNGIPMRMGTVDNDGYNAIVMSRNPEAVDAFILQMKVVDQSSKGVRLKDMPSEWFSVPADDAMGNSMVAARGVFTCNRLMDEHDFKAAYELMDHMLEIESGMVGLHRNLLVCDLLYTELIGEGRKEKIEELLSVQQRKFMKSMKSFPSVLRTEYVLALLFEKDSAKAENLRAEFEKRGKTYPYPQDVESERELMDIAKNKQRDSE